jgi:hypothetical protein
VWYGVDVATVLALVRLHVYRPTSNVRSEWLFTFDPSEEFDHPRNNMAAAGTTSPNPVQITNKSTMSADSNIDVEKQAPDSSSDKEQSSAFKALGWLDRLLALWILLAMIIGVLLGNFVPNTGPALQKGKFVGVSIPIGKGPSLHTFRSNTG